MAGLVPVRDGECRPRGRADRVRPMEMLSLPRVSQGLSQEQGPQRLCWRVAVSVS